MAMFKASDIDFGAEGIDRNFCKRGTHKAICCECGEVCLVYLRHLKGKPLYCKRCKEKKELEINKHVVTI